MQGPKMASLFNDDDAEHFFSQCVGVKTTPFYLKVKHIFDLFANHLLTNKHDFRNVIYSPENFELMEEGHIGKHLFTVYVSVNGIAQDLEIKIEPFLAFVSEYPLYNPETGQKIKEWKMKMERFLPEEIISGNAIEMAKLIALETRNFIRDPRGEMEDE
jgi:hypothetical protein